MRKTYILLMFLVFIFSAVSCASAFSTRETQSVKFSTKDGLVPSSKSNSTDSSGSLFADKTETTEKTAASRKEGYLRVDSIQPLGDSSDESTAFFNAFSGLQFSYTSQSGETPSESFVISLSDYPILSYALQRTDPYFISSNLLGEKTYMIYPEDKFEEKLVDAVYRLAAKYGTDADLPDINEAYEIIQSIRDGNIQITPAQTGPAFSFDKEIDTSAFEMIQMNLMTRFTEAEPTDRTGYYYTDLPLQSLTFEWPDEAALPIFPKPAIAVSGTYTQEDLLDLFEALPQFFADNPELAAALNQYIQTALAQTNPETAQLDGADFLSEILNGLKETVSTDMKDFSLSFKMDMDEIGTPVLFTINVKNNKDGEQTESILSFHMANDENQTILEIAGDSVQGGQTIPTFRGLAVINAGNEGNNNISINFRYDSHEYSAFEYSQKTENKESNDFIHSTNSDIHFDLNGERGTLFIFNTKTPNAFQGDDSFTQISYTHISQGMPLFTASFSGESKTTEPLPGLTASDAAVVSQMSEADYDSLVTNFFAQIMMLAMVFG